MVILVVALIVLGPKRLPEAGKQVGKALAEVRKWSKGFQDEIKSAIDLDDTRPSYSQPQSGYQPPLPIVPAETDAPADTGDGAAPPAGTNGSSVRTGSHGLVSGPPPGEPTDPPEPGPSGPPAGEPPRE
jgi:Tat protein translocase TatB subunit